MKRTHLSRLAAATAVLVLATGCSGPAGGPVPGATPSGRPLDAYLDPPVDAAKSKTDHQRLEELVAACMKDQGFEYTPVPPDDPDEGPGTRPADLSDRSWVEKYGYGISTLVELPQEEQADPNAERMEKMTKQQREAYFKALHGSGGGGRAVTRAGAGAVPVGPEGGDGGCFGKAAKEVYPDAKPIDFEEFRDLFDAIDELEQRIRTDQRVTPLVREWAGCLAGAGHSGFTGIDDPEQSIMKKWADLNGWQYDVNTSGGTPRGTVVRKAGSEGKEPDPEQVAALRAEEIELALADVDCRGDYQATVDQVRSELELRFIEEHREQLERYRDRINQGR